MTTLTLNPQQALKFIIIQGLNDYVWLFSSCSKDTHMSMAAELDDPLKWEVVAGGFYCFKVANAITKTIADYFTAPEPILELFGKSDSFGITKDIVLKVMPALCNQVGKNVIIHNKLF